MFVTFSHKLSHKSSHKLSRKLSRKLFSRLVSKAVVKAKGLLSLTFLLCLSPLFVTSPVAAQLPGALGSDKVAFAASSQSRGVSKTSPKNSVKKASAQQQKVDLNSASADEIAKTLSGVGPRKAQAMVKYRNEVGPFRSMDEVLEVKGFGPSILARNKDRIQLGKVAKKR